MKQLPLALFLIGLALLVALDRLARSGAGDVSGHAEQTAYEQGQTAIDEDGYSFVGGNPRGDITVVEYFDYRCGYCRSAHADLLKLIDEDGGIRLVLKEYPVLGQSSGAIAKVAMASLRQGGEHYWRLHNALMSAEGKLTQARALKIAEGLGLDLERLRQDLADPRLAENLAATKREGAGLGAKGTPAFVIGGKFLLGAISYAEMKRAVRAARQRSVA